MMTEEIHWKRPHPKTLGSPRRPFSTTLRWILALVFLGNFQAFGATSAEIGFSYGSPQAPWQVIEFSSLTCPHCAIFHEKVLPEIRKKYIETGQARLVCCDYPDNELAMQATLLVHCASTPEDALKLRELLFSKQSYWMAQPVPWESLCKIVKPFLPIAPETCVSNRVLFQKVMAHVMESYQRYKITHTPSFVIRNNVYPKALTFAEFETILAGGDPKISTVRSLQTTSTKP